MHELEMGTQDAKEEKMPEGNEPPIASPAKRIKKEEVHRDYDETQMSVPPPPPDAE